MPANDKMMFGIYRDLSNIRLNEIVDSLNIIEEGLTQKFQSWSSQFDKLTIGWSEEDKEEYIENHYDNLALVRETAPNIVRQSICLSLSGYFETALADLCRSLHKHASLNKPKEILHLSDSKSYLIKIANFPETLFDSAEWIFCLNASYVRNAIAHNAGKVPDFSDKKKTAELKSFVASTNGITLTQYDEFMIELPYCLQLIENIRACLHLLLNEAEMCFFP